VYENVLHRCGAWTRGSDEPAFAFLYFADKMRNSNVLKKKQIKINQRFTVCRFVLCHNPKKKKLREREEKYVRGRNTQGG
jgi:hypothetical protein